VRPLEVLPGPEPARLEPAPRRQASPLPGPPARVRLPPARARQVEAWPGPARESEALAPDSTSARSFLIWAASSSLTNCWQAIRVTPLRE
jgi:hypothetical protein